MHSQQSPNSSRSGGNNVKVTCDRKFTFELNGSEMDRLCQLINHGRSHLEDFIADLEKHEKVDAGLVSSHKMLIEFGKIFTNERARS